MSETKWFTDEGVVSVTDIQPRTSVKVLIWVGVIVLSIWGSFRDRSRR